MKVSVIGLGYVGCVSAACLAQSGHEIIGVDISQLKVDMINNGHSPIIEPGLSLKCNGTDPLILNLQSDIETITA